MTYEQVTDTARSFYLNYINTIPVDLEMLCEDFGWILREDKLCGEDGYMIMLNKSKKIYIYYDNTPRYISSWRYRFTIAHEIGHIILGHYNLDIDSMTEQEIHSLEIEANIFAAEILMPYSKLKGMDCNNIRNLASLFKVSNEAMETRLKSMGIVNDKVCGIRLTDKIAY